MALMDLMSIIYGYFYEGTDVSVIGYNCYKTAEEGGQEILTYMNMVFVFDPQKHQVIDTKIIGTRPCYPSGPAKKPELVDCAFTAGIVMREDGRADLYSGIGDCEVGRIIIDNPFQGFGKIAAYA